MCFVKLFAFSLSLSLSHFHTLSVTSLSKVIFSALYTVISDFADICFQRERERKREIFLFSQCVFSGVFPIGFLRFSR